MPWIFNEIFTIRKEGDVYHGWAEYVTYGGLPLTVTMKTEEQKINYLSRLLKKPFYWRIVWNCSEGSIVRKDAWDNLIRVGVAQAFAAVISFIG